MRKALIFVSLVAFLGMGFLTGCQQASTSTSLPEGTVASGIGTLGQYSLGMDNAIFGVVEITSTKAIGPSAPSTPILGSDNWWSSTDSYTLSGITYSITYNFKLWRSDGTLVNTSSLLTGTTLSNLGTLWTYTTYSITTSAGSFDLSLGSSKSNPLKFENYQTTEKLSGPIQYQSTYEGNTYTVSMTYSNMTVSSSGYPSGTVGISVSYDGSTVYEASMVFNGTSTATLTFTSGASGSYSVDLDTGNVTTTSL